MFQILPCFFPIFPLSTNIFSFQKTMAFFSFRQFLGLIGVILTAWILNKGQHILMFALDDFSENYTTFLGEKWWSTEQLGLCDDETLDVLWQRNVNERVQKFTGNE
ncbi:hypothetical protein CRE_08656 [Caenorhabditis remanei]|uniref:Uncharacterized protein n=1 Tax=Caenorhabditis remanei TaxID=31234 RepID=E3LJ78_CAERE|nr:hypothetical protein CRE_08656 [Caenorhabditis remanei]